VLVLVIVEFYRLEKHRTVPMLPCLSESVGNARQLTLPCLTTENADVLVQQSAVLEFVPRATATQNAHLLLERCPLVLEYLWSHNDETFLKNKLAILRDKSIGTQEDWSNVELALNMLPQESGCLKIQGCGHVFCAIPLLYMLATSCFRCPVCRFGNRNFMDMSARTPCNMPKGAWVALGIMSKLVKQHEMQELAEHENDALAAIAQHSFMDIFSMIPWQMTVSVYKRANLAPGDIPHACVHMNMRQENAHVQGQDMLFSSGLACPNPGIQPPRLVQSVLLRALPLCESIYGVRIALASHFSGAPLLKLGQS